MDRRKEILNAILSPGHSYSREDLIRLLDIEDKEEMRRLFEAAYRVKLEHTGNKVYFRGIIEFSNICTKDCFYCGIRKSNPKLRRFTMPAEEIVESALWACRTGYGSIVLQSGERCDEEFVGFIEDILRRIRNECKGRLGVTLSLGEQSRETYSRWFSAGAHRYLLRIETSNSTLYRSLHPEDHQFEQRLQCLHDLHETGYQVGTGVMIGLPGQTTADLADDILFFRNMDIDMIGMGPYLIHRDTPLAEGRNDDEKDRERRLDLGLKMIAATRLFLQDVNIASTTALQALLPTGREMGLMAGANIIMPNITDPKYRTLYQLYEGKPCLDENASLCQNCLKNRIESIGESIGLNEWGDSPHFQKKKTGLVSQTKNTRDTIEKRGKK